MDSVTPASASEGGSIASLPPSFFQKSFEHKLQALKAIADANGYKEAWNHIVTPWLEQDAGSVVKAVVASEPSAVVLEGRLYETSAEPLSVAAPTRVAAVPSGEKKTLQDLVTDLKPGKPWQEAKYSAENAVWQGAAQRRRAHPRRTNVALGTCSVDLSGPHEETPRPGGQIGKNPCHYFLVLTVRPDMTAQTKEVAVQTNGDGAPEAESSVEVPPPTKGPLSALYYVALLGTKCEAPVAIKHLLAQVNNDHASFPTELVFRLHSDRGGEFMNEELNQYCLDRGIHKTSTAGYDPNANPAESAVGILKRRSRFLLSGARLPTNWWGVSTLAAAQLCRADALSLIHI